MLFDQYDSMHTFKFDPNGKFTFEALLAGLALARGEPVFGNHDMDFFVYVPGHLIVNRKIQNPDYIAVRIARDATDLLALVRAWKANDI